MADTFATSTTAATWIPEVWSRELVIARESNLVMANLIWRFDVDVASFGDIVHVPSVTNLSAGAISTSTGQIDAQAPTETETLITINQWYGVRMKVLDIVLAQSKYEFRKLYTEKMAYALGVQLEDALLTQATSITNNAGSYATALTDSSLRRAFQYLDDARVPFTDRHFIMKPATKNTLMGIDKLIRYDATGTPSPVKNGEVPSQIYGASAHVSPEVYISASNVSNLLFHKDAFALAMQKEPKMEQFARVGFLDDFGGSQLYGYQIMRNDHAVEVRS